MKAQKILTAAVFATFAVAAQAAPLGAGGPGCPAGATPGTADCPARGAGHGTRGAGMLERLKAADTNADGMISRDEAQLALPRLYEHFDAIDANKDGLVTHEEMQAARHARHAGGHGRGEGWKKWDANGDGKLSRDEVANAPRLAQEFDAIDTNQDGFISVEELQAARGRIGGRGRPS